MRRLWLSVAVAMTGVATLSASPASAAAAGADARGLYATGYVVVAPPLNPQQKLVVWGCVAVATTPASLVSIDRCDLYVDGALVVSSQDISLPGQTAATSGTAAVPGWASEVKVCWSASAEPLLGPRVTDSGCASQIPPPLAE